MIFFFWHFAFILQLDRISFQHFYLKSSCAVCTVQSAPVYIMYSLKIEFLFFVRSCVTESNKWWTTECIGNGMKNRINFFRRRIVFLSRRKEERKRKQAIITYTLGRQLFVDILWSYLNVLFSSSFSMANNNFFSFVPLLLLLLLLFRLFRFVFEPFSCDSGSWFRYTLYCCVFGELIVCAFVLILWA